MSRKTQTTIDRQYYTLSEFFQLIRLSRTAGYAFIRREGVEVIKVGAHSLVSVAEADRVIAGLPRGLAKSNARAA